MGALDGVKIVELGGIGPGPFSGMMLSDMGADVTRLDRVEEAPRGTDDVLFRGRRSVLVDLKADEGKDILRAMLAEADVLIEGFRPGVIERLGFSPEACWEINPRLVIGRMTGWGQEGPIAHLGGHDINYISLAGALHPIGETDGPPVVPLNLVGDYGGGGLLLAYGVVCALFEAARSGQGQVVDAAMIDGAAILMAKWHGEFSRGRWQDERGSNGSDGGAPYYRVYETADGRHMAVGALEEKFYVRLIELLGLDLAALPDRWDKANWTGLIETIGAVFKTRTMPEWAEVFDGEDACTTPIPNLAETPDHPHIAARGVFFEQDGIRHPAPAPRLGRTPATAGRLCRPGEHTDEVLTAIGLSAEDIARHRAAGVVG